MLGHNLLLVLDSLDSANSTPHSFQQLWHLFPQANLTTSGLTVHVTDAADTPAVEIVQGPTGQTGMTLQTYYGNTDPLQGWYSAAYGQTEKNHVVGYTEHGTTARYYTLIASGPDAAKPATVTATSTSTAAALQLRVCAADTSVLVTITNQAAGAAGGEAVSVTPNSECPRGH
jgi:hypothetical protein